MTPIHHPFQGERDPLRTQGEGVYQSVTSTKERGSQGEGGRDESPFPIRGGDRDESPFPKRGGGTEMSHPKGACPKGGSTNHNQGEGVEGRIC